MTLVGACGIIGVGRCKRRWKKLFGLKKRSILPCFMVLCTMIGYNWSLESRDVLYLDFGLGTKISL